jgi:hypothetical protein
MYVFALLLVATAVAAFEDHHGASSIVYITCMDQQIKCVCDTYALAINMFGN